MGSPSEPLSQLEVLAVDCQATAAAPRGHLLEIGWARVRKTTTHARACLIALPDGEQSGGIVVTREDAAALGEALTRLLLDSELARLLGARARRRAVDVFSYEAIGSRLADFLFGEAGEPA